MRPHTATSDNLVSHDLAVPVEMGGPGGATNPEQLFAAGYAACFHSALKMVARTRKMHIPISAGYYEDTYFRAGPAEGNPYPVYEPAGLGAKVGMPTCWDEWFPEVARAYSLGGAEVLAYPTAIGSEPDHPDFDTEPLWRRVRRTHSATISVTRPSSAS